MGDWQFSSCLGLGFEKSQLGCSFQPFSLPESPGAVLVWICISGKMDTVLEPDLGDTDDQSALKLKDAACLVECREVSWRGSHGVTTALSTLYIEK